MTNLLTFYHEQLEEAAPSKNRWFSSRIMALVKRLLTCKFPWLLKVFLLVAPAVETSLPWLWWHWCYFMINVLDRGSQRAANTGSFSLSGVERECHPTIWNFPQCDMNHKGTSLFMEIFFERLQKKVELSDTCRKLFANLVRVYRTCRLLPVTKAKILPWIHLHKWLMAMYGQWRIKIKKFHSAHVIWKFRHSSPKPLRQQPLSILCLGTQQCLILLLLSCSWKQGAPTQMTLLQFIWKASQ